MPITEHVDKVFVKVSKRIGALGRVRRNVTVDAANISLLHYQSVMTLLDMISIGSTVCRSCTEKSCQEIVGNGRR